MTEQRNQRPTTKTGEFLWQNDKSLERHVKKDHGEEGSEKRYLERKEAKGLNLFSS